MVEPTTNNASSDPGDVLSRLDFSRRAPSPDPKSSDGRKTNKLSKKWMRPNPIARPTDPRREKKLSSSTPPAGSGRRTSVSWLDTPRRLTRAMVDAIPTRRRSRSPPPADDPTLVPTAPNTPTSLSPSPLPSSQPRVWESQAMEGTGSYSDELEEGEIRPEPWQPARPPTPVPLLFGSPAFSLLNEDDDLASYEEVCASDGRAPPALPVPTDTPQLVSVSLPHIINLGVDLADYNTVPARPIRRGVWGVTAGPEAARPQKAARTGHGCDHPYFKAARRPRRAAEIAVSGCDRPRDAT